MRIPASITQGFHLLIALAAACNAWHMQASRSPVIDAHRRLRHATILAAAVLAAGMAMLVIYSVAEAIANPGISVIDGYWRGQLPWMGIIEALIVGGASACLLVGAATIAVRGGWLRRWVALLPFGMAAFWWFLAWARAGISGGACVLCPAPAFDPWAYAYSGPMLALQLLIVPAIVIVVLALAVSPRRTAAPGYISPS